MARRARLRSNMKRHAELTEENPAFQKFDETVKALLAVPRSEILRRDAEYRKQAERTRNRRGPKPRASKERGESGG